VNFGGILAIAFGMSIHKNCLRTKLRGGAQGHSRVHAEFSGGVGCGGDYSALVALSADDDWLAFQARVEKFFDRHEEGVHVDVEDGARRNAHRSLAEVYR